MQKEKIYNNNLQNLTKEEWRKVWESNKRLQNEVLEDAHETEMSYLDEQLGYFSKSLARYEINPYGYSFMNIRDVYEFIEGVSEMERCVPLLNKERLKLLDKCIYLKEEAYACEVYSDELYEKADELAEEIIKAWKEIFDYYYNDDELFFYFYEFYIDFRLNIENLYIDEDYVLYETITTVKKYV